ncbi:D-TA family PLP-dependent enzyme [Rhabdobacter roseus]|uniref:D-serine deaminase-like pyridoxal phosphate-dependent protein n=1 Tax=Rhabdobacter roseus TaxID=1655419 RepID=A0A840TWN0_9BACT|nr:D-TA family PLP-dependent enzyme [Rhabdobacter roseus]MBB5284608.1 D-serine deaminase-like pyridoxal phosphate-dependent protein [Rhabdobacter roseus]
MNEPAAWYLIQNLDELDTPALVIYPERVRENIGRLKSQIDDPARLRPHVKTNKSADATRLLLAEGIQQFKCATIAEAEMLAQAGAADVLLAYQPVGPKVGRFLELIARYPRTYFACLVDHLPAAERISEQATLRQLRVPVYVDLNVGMNRTGIRPGAEAVALYEACAQLPGVEPVGLHAYDGHIHESDLDERRRRYEAAFAPVDAMLGTLGQKGYLPKLVAGGTPTFPFLAARGDAVCSPGTFLYWDKGYQDLYPEQDFLPAALVLARIISRPSPRTLCLDLGYKAVASENPLDRRVFFLNAPELRMLSHSEEHLVVEAREGHSYQVGEVLYGLPIHICPTCAAYERALTVENGWVNGQWEITARDRRIGV